MKSYANNSEKGSKMTQKQDLFCHFRKEKNTIKNIN